MASNRTGGFGVERRPRDYRGRPLDQVLPQHLRGERMGGVTHACPECGVSVPRPLCPVCLGAGTVTAERLDRYQLDLEHQAAAGTLTTP